MDQLYEFYFGEEGSAVGTSYDPDINYDQRDTSRDSDEQSSDSEQVNRISRSRPSTERRDAVGKSEGCTNRDIFKQFKESIEDTEEDYTFYLLTFCPLNSNYNPEYNAIDYIRRHYTSSSNYYLITKEVMETKVHYNLLISSNNTMLVHHGKRASKFYIHAKEIKLNEQLRVFKYITKEYYEQKLLWKPYKDYLYYIYTNGLHQKNQKNI